VAIERFPVEAGQVLQFARAIGDPNPEYAVAQDAGAAVTDKVAPPTFVQVAAHFDPEYSLRPRLGEPWWGSGRTPSGVPAVERPGGVGLHAEQHFEYHRPVRVGDVLSAVERPGETWEKQGRSGTLVFTERILDYRDDRGELVVTARIVAVRTEGPDVNRGGGTGR
jgi:hypothetical protein